MPDLRDMFYVTIIGLSVVFALLIVLMYIIVFRSKVVSLMAKKRQVKIEVPIPAETIASDDNELFAVLAAAVYAMMNTGDNDPKIRVASFKRIGSDAPVWNYASRKQNVE